MIETGHEVTSVVHPEGIFALASRDYKLALGGIRMIEGTTVKEVEQLAIAMDLKLATFGFPISGAKAGIDNRGMDLDALVDFLKRYRPILLGESTDVDLPPGLTFITGPDIGTSEQLFNSALQKAGLGSLVRRGLLAEVHPEFGLPLDNITTAYGVIVSLEEAFNSLSPPLKGFDPLHGYRYALEGFGKVGTGIARLLEGRCSLVAVSNRHGTVVADGGCEYCVGGEFDVSKLIQLQQEHGDNFILMLGHEVLPHLSLFQAEVDFLVPGARTESITREVADAIVETGSVRVISPASNFPYTEEGLALLENMGVICIPDFIANAGAVLAAMAEFSDQPEGTDLIELAMDIVHRAISFEMKDLLIQGIACGCKIGKSHVTGGQSLYKLAIERAWRKRSVVIPSDSIREIANQILTSY